MILYILQILHTFQLLTYCDDIMGVAWVYWRISCSTHLSDLFLPMVYSTHFSDLFLPMVYVYGISAIVFQLCFQFYLSLFLEHDPPQF